MSDPIPARDRAALEQAAQAAEAAGQVHRAIEARKAIVQTNPAAPEAHLALARALQRAGEPRAAIEAYKAALGLGAAPGDIHLQLGVLHHTLFEYEPATAHLQRVLTAEPQHADALCMLGIVSHDRGRFGEAVGFFERALASRPAFPEALFNLGLSRYETGNLAAAAECIGRCFERTRGAPWISGAAPAGAHQPRFEPRDMAVNRTKVRHDCEQLEYLVGLGRLPASYRAVLDDYRALLAEIEPIGDDAQLLPFDERRHPHVARTYKRPIHVDHAAAPPGSLLSDDFDSKAVEERYLASRPNVTSIESLLSRPALDALRRFCRESTIWNHLHAGYLGAYFYDGFCSELLLRLAREFRARFPRIVRGLPLQMMWAYKCDARLSALGTHADAAAVNVNFWITEDEANLDPQRGGLLVYTQDAPREWGFAKFNKDQAAIARHLESSGAAPLRVPYRANRAVVFDSDLFHASDRPRFREGYVNRRINITLLYGLRDS